MAVYKAHSEPNIASIGAAMGSALANEQSELVVALNGIDAVAARVPEGARIVDLRANLGVAPAWNAAAEAARGDVLVFSNDDVELGPRSLMRLAAALRDGNGAEVVGPAGSWWDLRAGVHQSWARPGEEAADARRSTEACDSTAERFDGEMIECDVVSGFLFACRRAVWQAVGGFDEFYAPASFEEVDFCTAVRAYGGRCYVVPGVDCRHAWGVSRRQMPWARARWDGRSETWRSIHRRNRRHFLEKWSTHPIAGNDTTAGRHDLTSTQK